MPSFHDEPVPHGLYFINAPEAKTRREATAFCMTKTHFVEKGPCTDGVAKVLATKTQLYADDSIIGRQVSVQQDGTIRKSARYGCNLRAERQCLELVAQQTNVPVPRVHDCYQTTEFEHLVLERMPGVTLEVAWTDLSARQREDAADQVVELVGRLRRLQSPTIDAALHDREPLPPGLRDSFDLAMFRMRRYTWLKNAVDYVQARCEAWRRVPNVFTHADLDWSNVMVLDNKVCGLIDMECSGFFPPYWEWFRVKRLAQHAPRGHWFCLLEERLARQQSWDCAGIWEVETLLEALDTHSGWALSPGDRLTHRTDGWAQVSAILGTDLGLAPEVDYGPRSKLHPWWLEHLPEPKDDAKAELANKNALAV